MSLKKREVALVYAKSKNGVIGLNNTIPWRCSADLAEFKRTTMGGTVIMGRKTWESLPVKPLPDRQCIVVTNQPGYEAKGAEVAHSLEDALGLANNYRVFIIGGASLYQQGMQYAHTIYETTVQVDVEGDTFALSEDAINEMGFIHLVTHRQLEQKEGDPVAVLRVVKRQYRGEVPGLVIIEN